MNTALLENSLLASGLTTLFSTSLGLLAALTGACLTARARRVLLLSVVVVLALPPFLVTGSWLDLLGQNAGWRAALPFTIFSLGGAVWLLTLLMWPLTTLSALGAWSRLEAGQLEMEPRLRGWSLFRYVLWPMARGAVAAAAGLTFVLVLNNFAVPVILQVKVFPEELWLAFTTRLDEAGAWAACLPMVIAPLALLLVLRRTVVAWPTLSAAASAPAFRRQLGSVWIWFAGLTTALLLLLSLALPLQRLLGSARTWTELPNLFRAAPDTVWNSFFYAAVTATGSVVLGLVSWRRPLGLMLWIPFLVPGVLLGRLMIGLWNGTAFYGTAGLVALAFLVRYAAPAWNLVALAPRAAAPSIRL